MRTTKDESRAINAKLDELSVKASEAMRKMDYAVGLTEAQKAEYWFERARDLDGRVKDLEARLRRIDHLSYTVEVDRYVAHLTEINRIAKGGQA